MKWPIESDCAKMAMLTTERSGKKIIGEADEGNFSKTSKKRAKPGKTGKKSGVTP